MFISSVVPLFGLPVLEQKTVNGFSGIGPLGSRFTPVPVILRWVCDSSAPSEIKISYRCNLRHTWTLGNILFPAGSRFTTQYPTAIAEPSISSGNLQAHDSANYDRLRPVMPDEPLGSSRIVKLQTLMCLRHIYSFRRVIRKTSTFYRALHHWQYTVSTLRKGRKYLNTPISMLSGDRTKRITSLPSFYVRTRFSLCE